MFVDLDCNNNLNILFLLLQERNWNEVEKRARASPGLARKSVKIAGFFSARSASKVNALQMACSHQPPPEVIQALHIANRKMVYKTDAIHKRSALHVAIMNQASDQTVTLLIQLHPQAVRLFDCHGRLPIHYACKINHNQNPDDCISSFMYLLQVYPESASIPDKDGFLPIHFACQSKASMISVIRLLIRVAPESTLAQTMEGRTPVQIARQSVGEQDERVGILLRCESETSQRRASSKGGYLHKGSKIFHSSSMEDEDSSSTTVNEECDLSSSLSPHRPVDR
jgi:hypothetical protein